MAPRCLPCLAVLALMLLAGCSTPGTQPGGPPQGLPAGGKPDAPPPESPATSADGGGAGAEDAQPETAQASVAIAALAGSSARGRIVSVMGREGRADADGRIESITATVEWTEPHGAAWTACVARAGGAEAVACQSGPSPITLEWRPADEAARVGGLFGLRFTPTAAGAVATELHATLRVTYAAAASP